MQTGGWGQEAVACWQEEEEGEQDKGDGPRHGGLKGETAGRLQEHDGYGLCRVRVWGVREVV